MSEKKYNVIDTALQEVSGTIIKLSDEEKKRYKEHLGQVLLKILENMRKDDVFKYLYRTNMYTGSFYENLRISKPDEFDINLIFVLPATCKIVYDKKQPGFVKIKVNSLDEAEIKKHLNDVPNLEKVLRNFIDKSSGYLMRTSFMQWMQGVFTKALKDLSLQHTEINPSASGPAFTIKVSQPKLGLSEYSVDLVPVFEFSDKDWPPSPVRKLPKGISNKEWTVVPKAVPDTTDSTFWRISFYKQEKEIMNNLYGMKHTIKLIKLFRDTENWKSLSSYAIKTMFLWEGERRPKDFWQNGIGQLFVHMLQILSEHLNKESIPFYWDKELNLLSKVKSETMVNMNKRITQTVLKQIDLHLIDNPQLVKKYFRIQKEIQNNNKNVLSTTQPLTTKRSLATAPVTTIRRNQNISPVISTTDKAKSSITIISNLEEPCEKKINLNVQYSLGCSNDMIDNASCKVSDSAVHLLSALLKEQREIKGCLQSLTQQCTDIKKEIRKLQEENAFLNKFLSNRPKSYDSPILSSSASPFDLIDLQPSINQNSNTNDSLL